jgi:hypothetical protein
MIGHEERGGGEAELREQRIGMLGEAGVAVVKGQEEFAAHTMACPYYPPREFLEAERAPPRLGQAAHLPFEDRAAHPGHPQLGRPRDAMVAEDGRGHAPGA